MCRLIRRVAILWFAIFMILMFSNLSTVSASNQYYETVKDNVPVWSEDTSKSIRLLPIPKAGTRVIIVSIAENKYGNEWGKTDKGYYTEKGNYIYMGNLKPVEYEITFENTRPVNIWYETIRDKVPVWYGPSSKSPKYDELEAKKTRVKIVKRGINEFGNEWGKIDQGMYGSDKYIYMGNLEPQVDAKVTDFPHDPNDRGHNNIYNTFYNSYMLGNLSGYKYQCVSYVYNRYREKFSFGPGQGVGFGVDYANGAVDDASNVANETETWNNGITTTVRTYKNDNGANIVRDSWVSFNTSSQYGHIVYVEDVLTIDGTKYVYFSEGGSGYRKQGTDGKMKEFELSKFLNRHGVGNYIGTITFLEDPGSTGDKKSTYTLKVISTNPTSGVSITSSTNHSGTTPYTHTLVEGTSVSLTAPQYVGSGASRKSFSNWSGASSSTNRTISLTMSTNRTVTAIYVNDPEVTSGSLQVNIEPDGILTVGAKWRLTSGPDTDWKEHGDTITDLAPGSYTVIFQDVTGWNTPANIPITVIAEQTAVATGVYTEGTPRPALLDNLVIMVDSLMIVVDLEAYGTAYFLKEESPLYLFLLGESEHIDIQAVASVSIYITIDEYATKLFQNHNDIGDAIASSKPIDASEVMEYYRFIDFDPETGYPILDKVE